MTNQELKILKAGSERLKKCTKTDWKYGDLDEWSEFGKKLQQNIFMFCEIIDSMEVSEESIQIEENNKNNISLE